MGKNETTQLPPKPRILGISGSPRKGGNSDTLVQTILEAASHNSTDTAPVNLGEYDYSPCVGCERCRKDGICTRFHDGMNLLYPQIESSQGLVLACPSHNYNITAWMKAFIDRLYCYYIFDNNRPRGWKSRLAGENRKAVIAGVCEQTGKEDMGFTMDAMRAPLTALGYDIIGEVSVYGIFDKGRVRDNADAMAKASELGARLAQSLTT